MEYLLYLAIVVPIAGAFLLPLISRISAALRNGLALLFVLCSFVCSAIMLPSALHGNAVQFYVALPLGMSFGFLADGLAVFMAMISSFVGAIIVLYSFTYIDSGDKDEYYLMVTLFLGAMMGLVYSTNLILLYTFWEISAVCCWRLIGYYREKEYVFRANKAFLVTVFGALMMLLGFLLVYQQTGSFSIPEIQEKLQGQPLSNWAVALILLGLLSKSATLPLHTWLPDAGVAPAPVTSLLHAAVLVKIGVYAFARLFLVSFSVGDVWHTVVPVVAAVSALVSAGAAIRENDLKRIIAYSTVSQLGFIFLGLSSGSAFGIAGGLLYILMHSIAKGGLFLCAGVVEHNTHTKDIRKLGGLIKTMPVTAVSFLLCAFSIMGIPPFGGFFSKYMVIGGAAEAGNAWISAVFVLGAVMTIIYLLRAFMRVFLGQMRTEAREESRSMVASVAGLGALSLLSGLLIMFPAGFVQDIVTKMGGMFQ
ncbi:MAG: NADH-quinone oxidoreductase subunit L [Firmicutes bacterium]|nr:NADH-quinone oxidoreductase subunit L [Bacillota bacterium]